MVRFSKVNYSNDVSKLLSSYAKKGLSTEEDLLAYTPARILSEFLEAYMFIMKEETSSNKEVISFINNLNSKWNKKFINEFYKDFSTEIKINNLDIVPEYIFPLALSLFVCNTLEPTLISEEEIIAKKRILNNFFNREL